MRYLGGSINFGVYTLMKISNIVLVSSLLLIGNSLFAQTNDSITTKNTHRQVQKITYYPAQYNYISTPRNYISGFALGFDYTNEAFTNLDQLSWDSTENYTSGSSGFNMYGLVMPKAIQRWKDKSPSMGSLNWGFGFNVNQFHKSRKERVVINTVNQDSAHTRLETANISLYTMARYEWAWGKIHPFIGFQGGVSLLSTDQVTETYMMMTEYESLKQENITTNAAFYWAPEVGVRLRMSNWASLVLAHEWKMGTQIELADVNNTQFNGVEMQAKQQQVNYQTGMWKLGILFDLSTNHRRKELVKESYYDTTMVMEEIQENKPCPPCPCETNPTPRTTPVPRTKTDMEVKPMDSTPSPAPVNPRQTSPTIPNTIQIPKKSMPTIVVPTPPKKKS